LAYETSTGEAHAFLAIPTSSVSGGEVVASAEQAGTSERKQVVLTENVRKQLQQRLRLRLPGPPPTAPQ